jgi:hypothetical protein
VSWPFASTIARLAEPDSPGGLVQALRPGNARFFRRYHAWKLRRAQRAQGGLSRELSETGSAVRRGARRTLAAGFVSPVRRIFSAPLALVGGLGTRLYFRGRRPRGGN